MSVGVRLTLGRPAVGDADASGCESCDSVLKLLQEVREFSDVSSPDSLQTSNQDAW